jgi:hypothetical protein
MILKFLPRQSMGKVADFDPTIFPKLPRDPEESIRFPFYQDFRFMFILQQRKTN